MAQLFLSESSRRNCAISRKDFDAKWMKTFGEREKMRCPECHKPTHKIIDGQCDDCRKRKTEFKMPEYS